MCETPRSMRSRLPNTLLIWVTSAKSKSFKGDGGKGTGTKISWQFVTCHYNFQQFYDKLREDMTLCSCDQILS